MSVIIRNAGRSAKMMSVCLAALIFIAFLLCGCGRSGTTELRWQSYPLVMKCGISCDDRGTACEDAEIVIEITSPYMGELTFVSPESLVGYNLSIKEEGAFISYDGLTIPLGDDAASDLTTLFSLFSLDPECMSDITVNKQSGTTVSVAVFSLYPQGVDEGGEAETGKYGTSEDESSESGCIGTVSVYISAAGEPLRFEAEFANGERLVLNVRNCEYALK